MGEKVMNVFNQGKYFYCHNVNADNSWWNYKMNYGREMKNSMENTLSTISGGNILDVATGSGGFITFLIDSLESYTEITGIDCNERSIEAARKAHSQPNIHFLLMDGTHLDFPDSHFDTVCMANSLHHMADLPTVLSEMLRVCKPGGNVIISEMYRDGQSETQLTHVNLHHWWAAVDTAEGITHYPTFTRQEIMDVANNLSLQHRTFWDDQDLESNPKDPEMIRELDGIIDRYIQRSQGLNGGAELCQRGEELRKRVHEVGFQGACSLFMIGKK
jgi:ubiquinone/menaquinone biosynthesis C-methylase UbiE